MDEYFLLNTQTARQLYQYVEKLPIIDYHNHLSMDDLDADRKFNNIAELWLLGDPYKHRAMRICGIKEDYITGKAEDWEKFQAWMSVLPRLIGNPLYDWSIMEMKKVFDIDLQPGVTDASWLWKETGLRLSQPEYSAMNLLNSFNVEYAAPCAFLTDDISVYLKYDHIAPSMRGDNIVNVTKESIEKLERAAGTSACTLSDYLATISHCLEGFNRAGCRFSDHALDQGFVYFPDDGKNDKRFECVVRGEFLSGEDDEKLESEILRFLAGEYARLGWTMQLHIGAQRSTSSRLRKLAGPAGGFAGIGNCCDVSSLTKMLDDFEEGQNGLPRMLLFTLNPADNAVMSVLSGSYCQDCVVGKVQQGPAWWWCDHLYGIREVFDSISAFSVLSVFIGMTTDSRSILSFVRHDYFRRALCGWLGEKVARGDFMVAESELKKLVEAICYYNAKNIIDKGAQI